MGQTHGQKIHVAALVGGGLWTAVSLALHWTASQSALHVFLVSAVLGALASGWFVFARERKVLFASYVAEGCVLVLFAFLREQCRNAFGWEEIHDVYFGLFLSAVLAGAKQWMEDGGREIKAPGMTSIFVLPVLTLGWVFWHGLGTDMALLVVGLHSVLFAFMGKDDRSSPYSITSVIGFILFFLLVSFRFELSEIHYYVIPVGVGILTLLQLLGKDMNPESRNRVRWVTLLMMMGSVGWYVVAREISLKYNLALMALGLAAMGLGGLLRVRVYLLLGSSAVVLDLFAILFKILIEQESQVRNIFLGSLIVGIGVILVVGAVWYKGQPERFDGRIRRLRELAGEWE